MTTVSVPTALSLWTTFAPTVSVVDIAGQDKVAIPPANVPFGYCTINGQRVPVYIGSTWYKYENNLYQRTGGPVDAVAAAVNGVTEAISIAATASNQVNDVQVQISQQQSEIEQLNEQVIILDGRVTDIEP